MTAPRLETQIAIERLIAYEIYLLDEKRLDEWLDLFTEDGSYKLSVREVVQPVGQGTPTIDLVQPPLINETRAFLATRVMRLGTRLAHAEQPPSLTRHLVTNVLILDENDDEAHVSANFQVFQKRIDISEHTFYGRRDDRLRRVDGQWKIASRHAILDASLLPRTLSIFF